MKHVSLSSSSVRVPRRWLWALGASVVLAGCATGPTANPADPLEPWNRGVYSFNDAFDRAVFRPVTVAYTKVTPGFVQTGVRNVFSNLGDAWSAVNSVLQFKGQEAMNNFWRFAINTSFGLGGIFDVASEARIPQKREDFGLTLAHWGMGPGPYLVLPILGPSTLRDTAALPMDWYMNPVGAIHNVDARNGVIVLSAVNTRAGLLDTTDLLDQAALDPYSFMRDAYLQNRQYQVAAQNADGSVATPVTPASGAASATDGYAPPPDGTDGYEPPLEGQEATTAPEPAASAAETATGAASAPAAAASAEVGATGGMVAPKTAESVGQQSRQIMPAAPQLLNRLNNNWGGTFWKR